MTQGTLDKTATANSEREVSVQVPISSDVGRVIQETHVVTVETGTASRAKSITAFLMRRMLKPDQAWFWTSEWQEAEARAAAEYAGGLGKVFANEDEFFADLDR